MEAINDLLFVVSRLMSAGVVTLAALYVSYSIHRHRVTPVVVWWYVAFCLWTSMIFRWFVVWITMPEQAAVYEPYQAWLQPLTQTGYVLLAMAIVVMTYTHICARSRHYRMEHGHD